MKKILILFVVFSTAIYSQKKITFKDGVQEDIKGYKVFKNTFYYQSLDGENKKVEKKTIKTIEDLGFHNQSFEFNQLGLTPYLVVDVEGKKAKELYDTALNWIKETYENPDKVLKMQIDGKKLRFEGYKERLISINNSFAKLNYNGTYNIELSFKDGKYKFECYNLEYFVPTTAYVKGGKTPVYLKSAAKEKYFKKNGFIRTYYKEFPENIQSLLNGLNDSLKKYLEKDSSKTEEDDW